MTYIWWENTSLSNLSDLFFVLVFVRLWDVSLGRIPYRLISIKFLFPSAETWKIIIKCETEQYKNMLMKI